MKWTESRFVLSQVLVQLFRTLYCSFEADFCQAIYLGHCQSLKDECELDILILPSHVHR